MKSILLSIKPKYVELIARGEKTIEVRKTAPQQAPFKAYIYCTIGNGVKGDYLVPSGIQCGKVIGEFVCDKVYMSLVGYMKNEPCYWDILNGSCLAKDEIMNYGKGKTLYGWHISDLTIYDKPKELSEFKKTKKLIARTCGMQARNGLCRAIDHEELCDNIKCCFKTPCPPQSWCYVEDLGEEK